MSDTTLDFEFHLLRLNRYARSLTRDWSRADDLVQDTVVRAFAKAHLFRHDTNLRGWLVTIMHNEYINAARRFFRDPIMAPEEALDTIGYDETQTAPIELHEIRRAVARLPARVEGGDDAGELPRPRLGNWRGLGIRSEKTDRLGEPPDRTDQLTRCDRRYDAGRHH
jgi:RNA polymerase sigma factor (sigma-70 family)